MLSAYNDHIDVVMFVELVVVVNDLKQVHCIA
ncbi:hypothetical protein SMB34_21145 [Thalassospira permensis NBRC 106175]|jgi:hypothetical protein|uniref:Uncharacterized protein n=1 Tax=Thalassospira permensis NBRC 106175 TaxID=1353532 RepID=A0ABR4TMN1_9PROT|nr:hypothetical protein SMB34_21145 [Thalassospira permensis NBRC 106175]